MSALVEAFRRDAQAVGVAHRNPARGVKLIEPAMFIRWLGQQRERGRATDMEEMYLAGQALGLSGIALDSWVERAADFW